MNKFQAINHIRSNAVMSKPVKDTFEFRCNDKLFAVITKGEDKKYYVHRQNVKAVTADNFMQAVAKILPDFMELVAELCEHCIKSSKAELNRFKMAYERSIKSHNMYIMPLAFGTQAMGTGCHPCHLYDVESIYLSETKDIDFSLQLGQALNDMIKLHEKSVKDMQKEIDEIIVNL